MNRSLLGKYVLGCGLTLALVVPLAAAHAAHGDKVLYRFCSLTDCVDGSYPLAAPISDSAGNLYGTTGRGGTASCLSPNAIYCGGTVFELQPDGTETVLYSFQGGNDGDDPECTLITDSAGNFYGTTYSGGTPGQGTIFKLQPDGTETVLYAFQGGSDGDGPEAGLIADSAGNFYGTTYLGGSTGGGTVFELEPNGTETVLYTFQGGNDGFSPEAGLIADSKGNFYGTTYAGGTAGVGTVFKLAPNGVETVLYAFQGGSDGAGPAAALLADSSGNLYSTTSYGGGTGCYKKRGCGTVFKLAPNGTETVLYAFDGHDGEYPVAPLIADKAGNLYGTTSLGGAHRWGTAFKLSPAGKETILYDFKSGNDGSYVSAGLMAGADGFLYGTTSYGGGPEDAGTVFRVKK